MKRVKQSVKGSSGGGTAVTESSESFKTCFPGETPRFSRKF